MATREVRLARRAALIAASVHLAGLAALIVGVTMRGTPGVDVLRPAPLAALYAVPAILALAGLRGREVRLLVAAVCAAALALLPFSLHSFVLAPVAVVYLLAYLHLSGSPPRPGRGVVASLVCPTLLLAALLVLTMGNEAACYERRASGDVIVESTTEQEMMGGRHRIVAGSDVVESGCAGGIVTGREALGSLGLSATAVLVGMLLIPPTAARRGRQPVDAGRP